MLIIDLCPSCRFCFKFLEKVVYKRLYNFLIKYNILFDNQYGFRKNHSTALALLHLYDTLANAIDNKEYTMGVFIDLSKAFDTVNHEILLAKLQHYGIGGTPLKWFESYLSGREQFVHFNGYSSSYKLVKCGVPQGSVSGPLLFLIYINDICNVSSALDILLFADDTSIFFSHKVLDSLCLTVNNELVKLTDWFSANKLSINIKKSNYIIFRPRQKGQTFDIKVTLSNRDVIQVKETVLIGVILDEHLTRISHITNRGLKHRRRERRLRQTAPRKDWVENVVHGGKIRELSSGLLWTTDASACKQKLE